MFIYKTQGVCSTEIHIETEGDIIKSVEFIKGCPGNLFGISSLVKGMNIDSAIENKDTSCPDQLSIALRELKNK